MGFWLSCLKRIEVVPYFQSICNHFLPRARFVNHCTLSQCSDCCSSSRGWKQGRRWCDEIVDELGSQSVSDEHLVELASKERTQRATQYSSPATLRIDRKGWTLCWWQAGTMHFCVFWFVAQILDFTRLWPATTSECRWLQLLRRCTCESCTALIWNASILMFH